MTFQIDKKEIPVIYMKVGDEAIGVKGRVNSMDLRPKRQLEAVHTCLIMHEAESVFL